MRTTTVNEILTFIQNLQKGYFTSKFIKPYEACVLAAKNYSVSNPSEKITSENLSDDLKSYFERVGLNELDKEMQVDKSKNMLPIRCIKTEDDVNKIEREAIEIVDDLTKSNMQKKNDLSIMFYELFNNCIDHPKITKGILGFVSAQCWVKGNLGQIAIVDNGVGIRKSLSGNADLHDVLKRGNACKIATEVGVTGSKNKEHSGYGLAVASETIQGNNGNFIIISQDEVYSHDRKSTIEKSLLYSAWDGTIIVLEWNLSDKLDCKMVYDSWSERGL